jgi:hypothetical protein
LHHVRFEVDDRLQSGATGGLLPKPKPPWRDGATHRVISPLELMRCLASMVPRSRLHRIRFRGVPALNAKTRAQVALAGERGEGAARPVSESDEPQDPHHRAARIGWARLPESDRSIANSHSARVRDRSGTLAVLRRRAEDHRGDP